MNIIDSITDQCAQDLVYWPPGPIDEYHRETFGTPVDLKGRWEAAQELVTDSKGEEVVSMARAWVLQDVEEGGYLWLGSTADSSYDSDPDNLEGALRIIAFKKLPRLGSANEFLRQAHLNIGRKTKP